MINVLQYHGGVAETGIERYAYHSGRYRTRREVGAGGCTIIWPDQVSQWLVS